jgi:hypothetical protein
MEISVASWVALMPFLGRMDVNTCGKSLEFTNESWLLLGGLCCYAIYEAEIHANACDDSQLLGLFFHADLSNVSQA